MTLHKKNIAIIHIFSALIFTVFACLPTQAESLSKSNLSVQKELVSSGSIDQVFAKISEGKFDDAKIILSNVSDTSSPTFTKVKSIVDEYSEMETRREKVRVEKYGEQYKEYEKVVEDGVPAEPNNVNIAEAYVEIIKTHQLADEEQKKELLGSEFVKKIIAESLKLSRGHEAEGKWIEAYTDSYYWLSVLFEDNQQYKDYAEQLTEKAMIGASLQDTPCEMWKERFEGITPTMFSRAIRALDISYVKPIDYDVMAVKALLRCQTLAEVLMVPDEKIEIEIDKDEFESWKKFTDDQIDEVNASRSPMKKDAFTYLFGKTIDINNDTIKIPQEVLISQFTEASLETLDPYTNLIWPWRVKGFEKMMTQQFVGIGVEINKSTGDLKVLSLLPDTPAYYSGLDADDIIEEVDGEPTKDMTINCAVSKITGPENTDVVLTIKHPDTEERETLTITRARIVVPTVRGWQRTDAAGWKYMVDPEDGIGYVRITGFTETTVDYLKQAISQLQSEGLKGLVIDLRYNSGGYLSTAVDIVDMFVSKGTIVSTRPRWGITETHSAKKSTTLPDYPLVVLINGGSASASEIVAGALQDPLFKRATLVGVRSYGKGSVQQITPYPGGDSQMKYTMGYYHLPSGQKVPNRYEVEKAGLKDWGIAPDVEVEMLVSELNEYLDFQRDNDVLTRDDHNDGGEAVERHNISEALELDHQLNVAILVAKAKLFEKESKVVSKK